MKKRVAVIQFPGTNSEYETVRAVNEAGMEGVFFRWNENPEELQNFDAYIVAGGFSYEDRGRAGLIAAMDPIMQIVKKEAEKGKPVLGICNGAQILVETGLIPGKKLMCLAKNKRIKEGKLLGVGFYNEEVTLKATAPKGRTAFTLDIEEGELSQAPAAHGEGRFTTTIPDLLPFLQKNQQIVFRYSDEKGEIKTDFPVNPNGAMDNAAAICNPRGNVMAIMPHPERAPLAPMPKIFSSMKKYMEGAPLVGDYEPLFMEAPALTPKTHSHAKNTVELCIQLLITDNEAQTIEKAIQNAGFPIKLRKFKHFQVEHSPMVPGDQLEFAHSLVNSGEFLNQNKEKNQFVLDDMNFPKKADARYVLVRDLEDSLGRSKAQKMKTQFPEIGAKIKEVKSGILWEIQGDCDFQALLATGVFANPNAQDLFLI